MLKLALPILLLAASPAAAQDMPGAVDLGAMSRTQVQSSMADGYAERGGSGGPTMPSPNGTPLNARSRAYCEAVPAYRSRFGAKSARVMKLVAACRRAGYQY